MKIEMTNKGLDMSIKDDLDKCRSPFNTNDEDGQEICRSLVCDPSGIIFAEMVYRCMICLEVTNTMSDARKHYVDEHTKDLNNSNCTDQIDDLDDIWPTTKNIPKHLNKKLNHQNNLNNNHSRSQNGNNRNSDGLDSYSSSTNNSCTNKYRNSLEPIDMSPSSDSFERYQPLITINDDANGTNGSKSGYVNCAVCSVTKYYSNVQRRYGQYTCVTCYRYFKQFFDKPERYSCPNLGKCQLNVRTRCKACWIKTCINLFQVDLEKQQLIEAYAPVKQHSTAASLSASSINNSEDEHIDTLEGLESSSPIDEKMDQSDDNNNSINNGLNGHMNHSKEALSMMLALNNSTGDLPGLFSKSNLSSFNLLTAVASSQANSLFGNLHDNNNNSLINHHSNMTTNSLTNSLLNDTNGLLNGSTNSDQNNSPLSFLKPKRGSNKNSNGHLNGSLSLNNLSNQLNGLTANNLSVNNLKNNGLIDAKTGKDSNNNNKSNSNKQTKAVAGKKVWSCGKCATCVAEDCGKCIYCLDRPKFGGPFVKKQRCIKRRCLMKIKTKAEKKNNLSSNNLSNLSTNALPAVPTF